MRNKYLDTVTLDEALAVALDKLTPPISAEIVKSADALGRVTSEAVYARWSVPHYNASAMDGVATFSGRTFGATETTPTVLSAGEYQPVDTGDPLPFGCDCVIMAEDIIEHESGAIELHAAAAPYTNVRQIGEDVCQGEMLLPQRTVLTPAALGALLAAGVWEVSVLKRPVVGIIPTGDEIVPPVKTPEKGEIIEFNSSIFAGMIKNAGAEARVYSIAPDKLDSIKAALLEAARDCDMILINAGSSKGREDYTAAAIRELGEVFLHGVSIRPGKPVILGRVGATPCVGVPGYPVSGYIVVEQLVLPAIRAMLGGAQPELHIDAVLTRPLQSPLNYREFVRVKLGQVDGRCVVTPLNRGAGVITSLTKADGILDIPLDTERLEAGEAVSVRLLRREDEIESTIVIIGSHDPLLDELADIARADGRFISSSHVGSMGGVTAMRRGEAHVSAIHLLDEQTGAYNKSYFDKYFKDSNVRLYKGVGRAQGLIVQAGNPKGIRSVADLTREGMRFVNRQRGSGTRILLDYLLKTEGIAGESIYGYSREEYTHLSVAAKIASDDCDAGLGVYSAAKAYGLDFIEIGWEDYDFLVNGAFAHSDEFAVLLNWLRGGEFARRLTALGGYSLDGIGERLL